jgi:hypothetical protein
MFTIESSVSSAETATDAESFAALNVIFAVPAFDFVLSVGV